MEFAVIILAAGQGKRMRSSLPKPLHRLGGKPLLAWALDASMLGGAVEQVVITPDGANAVTGFIEQYRQARGTAVKAAVQDPPLGTGHAVECARDALAGFDGIAIVTFADTPLLRADTFQALAQQLDTTGAAVACLGFKPEDPTGYGRLVTDDEGQLLRIVEEKDASDDERQISLVNAGMMALRLPLAFELLEEIGTSNAQGEKYLTDIVAEARRHGHQVTAMAAAATEVMGINDRKDLAAAEAELQNRLRQAAMAGGATLTAPETVFLHHDTILEDDVVIEPHVVFGAGVRVGNGTEIKAFSHLEGVVTGPCCIIGPYARLRPGTELGEGVKIGNFVETKNTRMGDLSKANHLSYVGDSEVGAKANIGAGTITCNYDGFSKHRTTIGAGAFIGSNTALVAPVTVGDHAMVGAGSTITRDIEDDAMAVTRAEQRNLKNGASRFRQSRQKDRT